MFHFKFPKGFYSPLIILAVVFLLGLTGVFKPVRKLAEKKLIIPIRQKIFDWRRFAKKDLDGCVVGGEKEITELKTKVASLEEENRQQKRLLSSPLPKTWQFQTVKVIGTENETLTINAGSEDNLKEGMVVILGDTYLGRIYRVSASMSVVHLPTFLDEKLAVGIISEKSRLFVGRGLLTGWGEGGMKIKQIILSENVSTGDIVQTDVLGTNLVVGVIGEIIEKKGEMFKSALVKRQYNPKELGTVFLVKK